MKRSLAIWCTVAVGCSTCPQADLCDFFRPNRNACCPATVQAVPVSPAPQAVLVAPAPQVVAPAYPAPGVFIPPQPGPTPVPAAPAPALAPAPACSSCN